MPGTIKRIAVKVGSNVLTQADGLPNLNAMQQLVVQLANLRKKGIESVLISSGAMAAGRSVVQLQKNTDPVSERQLLAALGQVKLIQSYAGMFQQYAIQCAQVLVTRQDFKDRQHYLNMQNCLETLLQNQVLPIINENDVVSVTELMFTDNDELAGLVSAMLNVDKLIILTNVDGIYDGDPGDPGAKVISIYDQKKFDPSRFSSAKKSSFGRGGILTKCHTAVNISKMGIEVYIANGHSVQVLDDIISGKAVGTRFPSGKSTKAVKKWMAQSRSHSKGRVFINEGARQKLFSDSATSLLPVGITTIEGKFKKDDLISVCNADGEAIGIGKAKYNSEKAMELIGKKNQKPLVHYDHLYLFTQVSHIDLNAIERGVPFSI
jgi:glutamate 5-kinase